MIRKVIREGRAKGISDSDVLMYAKISAHSGIDIVFDKEATKVKNKAGEDTYRSAFYEWQNNRITVNPESKSGAESILIHELDHAVRNYFGKDGQRMTKVFNRALVETDESTRKKILEKSEEVAKPGQIENVFNDEVNAYYAERMLTNRQTLEKLIEAEPTLKDKILSFFKGASADYTDAPRLSGSAKWYYKKFKKMFDDFSSKNAQSNSSENTHLSTLFEKKSQKTTLTNINQENMNVSDRQYSLRIKNTDGTESLVNPYQTSREETIEYMRLARKGKLQNYTYFPVSSNTPKTIIDSLREAGISIEDRPLAMQADKARQSQIIGKPLKKNGFTIRYHAMEAEKIVEVIDNLDNPTTIIQQQNRTAVKEIDGKKQVVDLPDNYAVFVTLSDGKEYVAIIEVDAKINEDYIVYDGKGEKYHTTVTVFEPDVTRNGEPFDYIEYLLSREGNRELDIMKENPNLEDAIRQTEATTSKKEFSNNSIPGNAEKVKRIYEKTSDKQFALDIDSGEQKKTAKDKAQERSERTLENKKARLEADYTTDKVFSQASVKRGFDSVEAVKKLPGDVREKISRDLWLELEASESDDVRDTFVLKYSVKLYQAIRESNSEAYENMSPKQRDELQEQLRETIREIAKSGKKSKLSKMKSDVRGIVKLEERVRSECLSGIYQNLKKIDDKKKRRFMEASARVSAQKLCWSFTR